MKQVVAAIIVRKNEDEILICQRTKHQPLPLKWEFPGGKIEPGEQPAEALHRELEEELGIRAVIGPRLTSLQYTYANGNAVELHFYVVKEFAGKIENRIFRDVRWVQRTDLPDYDFLEADLGLVRDIAAGKVL
jgi:8-oxo-dGTP diphosphatase